MKYANQIMDRNPLIVSPDLEVRGLAQTLLDHNADGACVVEDDRLVGIVTSMDLIFQERRVHLPSFVSFMDRLRPGASAELDKVTGSTVRDIMTPKVKTVAFDAALDEVAGQMVDDHLTLLPVVHDEKLVGVITKQSVLRATLEAQEG